MGYTLGGCALNLPRERGARRQRRQRTRDGGGGGLVLVGGSVVDRNHFNRIQEGIDAIPLATAAAAGGAIVQRRGTRHLALFQFEYGYGGERSSAVGIHCWCGDVFGD